MTGGARPSVAYITLRYPPLQSSGTRRAEAVARYLPTLGYELKVATFPASWVYHVRPDAGEIGSAPNVLRPTARHDRLVQRMTTIPKVRWVLRELLIPEVTAPWARSVAPQVAEAFGDTDVVYATGPPFSALITARRVARSLGVPWVAEIRDPISFNRRVSFRSSLTRRRARRFEARHLTPADAVITVTPRTRSRLLQIHPELEPNKVHMVPNGYPDIQVDPRLADRDGRFTITYVGSYQGDLTSTADSWFTPRVVIPHLADLGVPAVLRLIGAIGPSQRQAMQEVPSNVSVEIVGEVDRAVALAEMAGSDATLILADHHPWWVGRKVFEALAYAQRIVAVVPRAGDTADLLAGRNTAWIAEPGDREGIGTAVRSAYAHWQERGQLQPEPPPDLQTDANCVREIADVLTSVLR